MIFGENRLLFAKVREAMSPTVVYCRDIDRSSLLYGNLYVSFLRLIVLRGCPKSLSLLGSSARSREKSCRPTVITWLVLAKIVPMSRHFCGPSNLGSSEGSPLPSPRRRHTGCCHRQ